MVFSHHYVNLTILKFKILTDPDVSNEKLKIGSKQLHFEKYKVLE